MNTKLSTISSFTPEQKARFNASNNLSFNLCVLQDYIKHSITSLTDEALLLLDREFDDIVHSFINPTNYEVENIHTIEESD